MRRIMSTPSYTQRTTKKNIISPWDRTVQAMMGSTSNNLSSSNGYNTHHLHHNNAHSNGNGYSNTANTNNSHRRSIIERIAIISMLMIAWGWIMTFCGMLFYHGYQYRMSSGGMGTGDTTATASRKKSLPILPIQQETSKHQLESRKVISNEIHDFKSSEMLSLHDAAVTLLGAEASPLLIFTCQRAKYLEETLSYILQYIPSDCTIGCPIIVSQDGHNTEVAQVIKDYQTKLKQEKNIPLIHLEHKSGAHVRMGAKAINPYEALAVHYGWALQQVFDGLATSSTTSSSSLSISKKSKSSILPQRVIILEEDLRIAPDFFDYFKAMAPILDQDTTLLAVSAFNDNGFTDTVKDSTRVLRSDFFPGLGWMMTRNLWVNELQSKWPSGYWDDWLREPPQRSNRHILHPEISRTYHFGTSGGASSNQFGTQLSKVFLNDVKVDWTTISDGNNELILAHYLQNQMNYDRQYWKLIEGAVLLQDTTEVYNQARDSDVRLEYQSIDEFKSIVHQLKVPLMDDEKAGIYRTAYKGIVETRPLGDDHFLFITPPMTELQSSFSSILPDAEDIIESKG